MFWVNYCRSVLTDDKLVLNVDIVLLTVLIDQKGKRYAEKIENCFKLKLVKNELVIKTNIN